MLSDLLRLYFGSLETFGSQAAKLAAVFTGKAKL